MKFVKKMVMGAAVVMMAAGVVFAAEPNGPDPTAAPLLTCIMQTI